MSSFLPAVKLWIWLSALASAGGWVLSSLGLLNQPGYLGAFSVGAILLWWCRGAIGIERLACPAGWRKAGRRFRRPLPAAFALFAVLVFLGSTLHSPATHTAYTYHIPRVLHWLAEGHWHWIHGPDCRMNSHASGMEWMMAPLLLFTKSDRVLFLLNLASFIFLPGLIFSVWTRLGVRPRAAWHWMWLLPTGYNFLLQAGSLGNDMFPAVYALAAVDFGCRARASRKVSDLWCSILAVALMTGAKASNLPLLLPWTVLVFGLLPLWRRRWIAGTGIVLLALLVSFLPNAALNKLHAGEWLGLNQQSRGVEMRNPLAGVAGNTFQILLNNFAPPIFPMAGQWNRRAPEFMPVGLVNMANQHFDGGFFVLGEIPTDDWAGIGFGVSALLAVALAAACWTRRPGDNWIARAAVSQPLRRLVLVAFWLAFLAYCVKSGMTTAARLITPYYALVFPALLCGARQERIVRQRWWRLASGGVVMAALVVLVIQPGRPLWPQQAILSRLLSRHPGNALLLRAQKVYSVYAQRSDPLAAVRSLLPGGVQVVGFLGTPDDVSISMWRPLGTRRVVLVLASDSAAQIRQAGARYVVVSGLQLKDQKRTLASWLEQTGAESVATTNLTVKITDGPQEWHVVRLPESGD